MDAPSLRASDAEFLVLLTGIDEAFSEMVHTRSSYKATRCNGERGLRIRSTAPIPEGGSGSTWRGIDRTEPIAPQRGGASGTEAPG